MSKIAARTRPGTLHSENWAQGLRVFRPKVAKRSQVLVSCACTILSLLSFGCRGHVSRKSPVRVIRDMTQQAHVLPQVALSEVSTSKNKLPWLVGTVAVEEPLELGPFETGRNDKGFIARAPIAVDAQLVARGKERFDIYCSGCHDQAGTGQGVIAQRGFPGPIELASDNTRRMTDGEIFSIITNGVRNMPAMGDQIPAADRWPIVVWLRVIQRSQHALIAEVRPISKDDIIAEEASP